MKIWYNNIMEIINWINNNTTLINLFSVFVTALATLFYVILTIRLVSENIKNRRMQIDPKIVMDIISDATHPYLLNFVLENIGNGVALNIKFSIKQEPRLTKSKKISDYGFIKNGLKSLSGKAKYKTFFLNTLDENMEMFKELIVIDISYVDISKRKYNEEIIFDLSYLDDIVYSHTEPEYKIMKEMENISRSLKSISQYFDEKSREIRNEKK
jgi:hypothetical protein